MMNYILFEKIYEYEFGFFVDIDTEEITAIAVNHKEYKVREIETFTTPEEAIHCMNRYIREGFSIGDFTFMGNSHIREVLI